MRARAVVVGALVVFIGLQLGLRAAMSYWPVLRDPDWGNRIVRLDELIDAQPPKPLLIVLGSSHTALGLRPAALMETWARTGDSPLVFNFSRLGNGPLFELLYLHRLLDRGIRPDWLIVEIWPILLDDSALDGREDERLDVHRLQSADWPVLARHSTLHDSLFDQWWWDELTPWYSQRSVLIGYFAPGWRPFEPFGDQLFAGLDPWGWREWRAMNRQRYRKEAARTIRRWSNRLESLRVSARADGELREILELCRERVIPASLLLMPESSDLRRSYSESSRRTLLEYLAKLGDEYGAPLIDTSDWAPDAAFGDADHLMAPGADQFSRRLAKVTGPPRAGRALAPRHDDTDVAERR